MNMPTLPTAPVPHALLTDLRDTLVETLGDTLDTLLIERVVVGLFFSGVKLGNGACGLSATPVKSIPAAVCCPSSALALPSPGKLRGRPAADLLDDLTSKQDMRRALAIATLNALVETLWQRDGAPATQAVTDGDTFEGMEIRPDDRVVLVGAFAPYMRELRKRQIDYRVLELDISTLKEVELPHYAHPDTAPEVIPWGTVLAVTGTTLINGTLDALLTHVRPGMKVAVIGPTAPLLVTPFAQRGVTHIGGARVRDPDVLLDILAEGGSGYHFFGSLVERLTLHAGRP